MSCCKQSVFPLPGKLQTDPQIAPKLAFRRPIQTGRRCLRYPGQTVHDIGFVPVRPEFKEVLSRSDDDFGTGIVECLNHIKRSPLLEHIEDSDPNVGHHPKREHPQRCQTKHDL